MEDFGLAPQKNAKKHTLPKIKVSFTVISVIILEIALSLTYIPTVPTGNPTGSLILILEPPEQLPCRRFENLKIGTRSH